jgi:2-C-methyl-D-erythritol 4-phosphate cytidylyltransferase
VSWGAIVVAAGRGTRFGRPKQLVELAGKPMLAWSIETFAAMHEVHALVITTEADLVAEVDALARGHAAHLEPRVIVGGAERQDSVRLALDALAERCDYVFVHDGARPMIRADAVRRGMAATAPGVGALLAIPAVDTIKELDPDGKVVRTLDRSVLRAAQTPQFAAAADLRRAHRDAFRDGVRVTDDATLLERAGFDVIAVEGDPENFKVTVPADLARAELILRERSPIKR